MRIFLALLFSVAAHAQPIRPITPTTSGLVGGGIINSNFMSVSDSLSWLTNAVVSSINSIAATNGTARGLTIADATASRVAVFGPGGKLTNAPIAAGELVCVISNADGLRSASTNFTTRTLGFFTPGDGGDGLYRWDGDSTQTTNHGAIWDLSSGATGRWIGATNNIRNVRQFGARGLPYDDSLAFQKFLASASSQILEIPPGDYLVSTNLVLTNSCTLLCRGRIFSRVLTGAAITLGITNGNLKFFVQGLNVHSYQQNWWTNVNVGVLLENLRGSSIHIANASAFGTNLMTLGSHAEAYSYNEHYLGDLLDARVLVCINNVPEGDGSANNENNFHGGRLAWSAGSPDYTNTVGILLTTNATYNDNRFFNVSIERGGDASNGLSTPILVSKGYNNEFNSIHVEPSNLFSNSLFAAGTWDNTLSGANSVDYAKITDLGDNHIETYDHTKWSRILSVWHTDAGTANTPYPLRLNHDTTATPSAGLGIGMLFTARRTDGVDGIIAGISAEWSSSSAGFEDGDLIFRTTLDSSLFARMRLTSAGNLLLNADKWYYASNLAGALQPLIRSRGTGYEPAAYPGIQLGQVNDHIALFIDPTSVVGTSFSGTNEIFTPNSFRFVPANSGGTDWIGAGNYIFDNGNLGLGIIPAARLHVVSGGTIRLENSTPNRLAMFNGDRDLTNATDVTIYGELMVTNRITISGTTNQVIFGSTNTAPSSVAAPTKWISVQVTGDSTVYRLPLYQ